MFFTFSQNNSFGHFVMKPAKGIGFYVIIEATTPADANALAENAGLYFYGVDDGIDCPCCGDRWHTAYSDDKGDAEPTVYSRPASAYGDPIPVESSAPDDTVQVSVHYLDGRIVNYVSQTDRKQYGYEE